jgi:methylated-DNA-[protein]-cysteine S-methyltransferase
LPSASYFTEIPSPIGDLTLTGDGRALTGLYMQHHRHRPPLDPGAIGDAAPFEEALWQLAQYFAGERTGFELPLSPTGTPFQRAVWDALVEIPYGETVSYGELARRVGRPAASRAVGLANGRNPISIVVPCHRVVGASGSLTGYGGGLDRKRFLLELEAGCFQLEVDCYENGLAVMKKTATTTTAPSSISAAM